MKRKQLTLILLSTVLGMGLCGSAHAAELKIGTVDLQKAVQETTAGKKAKKELKGEFDKKQNEIKKQEKDLKIMQNDLEKKRMVLSQAVLNKKQVELEQKILNYRKFVAQSQMEIQKREHDLEAPILMKMEKIINTIAQKGGYTVILERGTPGVVWAKKSIDITKQVVEDFDKHK